MGTDDIWGHEYINKYGESYPVNRKPVDWIFHFYYKENDGHAFMRRGPERSRCIRINPVAEWEEVKEAFGNYRGSKHGLDEKTSKSVFSGIENMIINGERDSEISC